MVKPSQDTVFIGGKLAARKTDKGQCRASHDAIAEGEPSVLVVGKPAARLSDPTRHGGRVVQGEPTVLIGHNQATECLKKAAKRRAAFVKNSDAAKRPGDPEATGSTGGKSGRAMDVDGAVQHLDANAGDKTRHRCAAAVREAIEQGGGTRIGSTGEARNYGPLLERGGFTPVANEGSIDAYRPQAGDVVVFQPNESTSSAGHMQMYNGSRWESDFRQNSFYASRGYRASSFTVYRP